MEGRDIIEIDSDREDDVIVIVDSEEEGPDNREDGIFVVDGYDDFEPADDMVVEDSDEEPGHIIEHAPAEENNDNDMAIANSDEEFDNMMEFLEHSDYNSSCSDQEVTHLRVYRDIGQQELRSLHELHKMCAISFYYHSDDAKFCTSCFFRWAELYTDRRVRVVCTKRQFTD
jgi:hypothetical protein